MFRTIKIENFKSIARAEFDLGMFTVLVGENGSGKSSVLRALDLLGWSASESLTQALGSRGIAFCDIVHGKARNRVIRLTTTLDIGESPPSARLGDLVTYVVGFRERNGRILTDSEHLTCVSEPPDENLSRVGIVNCQGMRVAQENDDELEFPEQHGDMETTMLRFVSSHPRRFPRLFKVAKELASFSHYEIWGPEHLREASRDAHAMGGRTDLLVEQRGENLPRVIRGIKRDKTSYREFLKELRQTFPRLLDVKTVKGLQPREFGVRFVEKSPLNGGSGSVVYRPEQVSDGLLRMVALLAIKHQPFPLPCLGYEEPENGLHPSALNDCMRHLKDIAHRGTQVIVTTHSPYLLNHILEDRAPPRAELRLVLRDRRWRTTIRPPDPEKIDRARRHGFGIGELWGMMLNEEGLATK